MSNSTQTIQSRNAAQNNSIPKKNTAQNQNDTGFSNLFTQAMANANPNAKLNTIQEELREALGQRKAEKNRNQEETTNSDNNLAAQTQNANNALWAQRPWSNPVTQPTHTEASQSTQASTNTRGPEQEQQKNSIETQQPTNNTTQNNSTNTHAEKSAQPESTQNQSTQQIDATHTQTMAEQPSTPATTTTIATQTEFANTLNEASAAKIVRADPTTLQTQDLQNTNNRDTTQTPNLQSTVDRLQTLQNRTNTSLNPALNPALNAAQASTANNQQTANNTDTTRPLSVGDKILTTTGVGATNATTGQPTSLTGTANTNTTLIKTPVNQPGFVREVAQQIQWSVSKNMSTVDLRVNPESLGPMNMRIIQKGQEVHLVIRTQDENASAMLTQAIHGLKETLSQSGLQLGQVQIHHGQTTNNNALASNMQQNNSNTQQQQQNGQQNPTNKNLSGTDIQEGLNPDNIQTSNRTKNTGNNGLDLFA